MRFLARGGEILKWLTGEHWVKFYREGWDTDQRKGKGKALPQTTSSILKQTKLKMTAKENKAEMKSY